MQKNITISIVYDNYKLKKELKKGWGFSCLIECDGKNILFDTGENSESLLFNIEKMGIKKIDAIVISHDHWDHTGGLSGIIKIHPNAKVYQPDSVKTRKITENVYVTGMLGESIKEQALVINSDKGLVIVTGCAHPGITNIVKKVKEEFKKKVHLVLGGFHSPPLSTVQDFKELGVEKAAPSHCTGDAAIKAFEEEYKKNFIKSGVGKIIVI